MEPSATEVGDIMKDLLGRVILTLGLIIACVLCGYAISVAVRERQMIMHLIFTLFMMMCFTATIRIWGEWM